MSSNASAKLVARDLHKEYPTPGDPLVILRGINLELSPGDALAIVGPSGSGKSTLLHILGTLDNPTRGEVALGGVNPFALKPNELARFRAQRIGFVFQDHHLLPQCTAMENVLLAGLALGKVGDDGVGRARELLGRVGLADRSGHIPAELSGGERQRVAVARALMNAPSVLLCDEPTGNLDQKIAGSVGALLIELARETGAILIVVTHSSALAELLPRRMRMEEGRLVEDHL